MSLPYERRWLAGSAAELARAQTWLKKSLDPGAWKLDLLGLEEEASVPGAARIAVRCTFADQRSADLFARECLSDAGPAPLSATPAPETDADAEFAEGAQRILAGPEPISAGKLHFLGLEKVRSHFGDQWPKLASRAEALVRRAIERRLSPQDVYRKTGDLNFVVMFASLTGQEAEVKCALIGEEIARMLVGDELGAGMLAVKTVATDVDGPRMLERLQTTQIDVAQAIEAEVEVERRRREAAPTEAPVPDAADPFQGLQFVYRPIWDVRRSAVANFCLMPAKRYGSGPLRYGESSVPGLEQPETRRHFDRLVLERAIADLAALHRQGRRLAISIPVHFESISVATRRTAYIARWRALPDECRQLGVFEVVGAPEGIPQGRVAEIVSHLRLESRGVLMRVALGTGTFRNLSDTGISAVGTDVTGSTAPEERLMQEFREFAANAERARLAAYVRGLRSFSLAVSAIGAGFSFIDGDPVSSATDQPEDVYRFRLDDLYAKRFK